MFKSLKQIDSSLVVNGCFHINVFPLMICVPLHRCNSDYQVHVMGHGPYVG
jgi:hypothetical protein